MGGDSCLIIQGHAVYTVQEHAVYIIQGRDVQGNQNKIKRNNTASCSLG